MVGDRQRGLRVAAWGMGLLLAAAGLHALIRPATSPAPRTAGAAAMRRAVQQSLSQMGGRHGTRYIWIGQSFDRVGGFPQRWADYVVVVTRRGHVVLWGTGIGNWDGGMAAPDLSLTVFPVRHPVSVTTMTRPQRLVGGYPVPPHDAHWTGIPLHSGAVAIAYTAADVWVYQKQGGVYHTTVGPVTFASHRS